MTLLCPYQQDCLSRGLSVQCPQRPNCAETNLHRATSAAGGTQQRSDTFATGAPQALPRGLPPIVHAQCAAAFLHIAGGEPPQLPDDFFWALRLSAGQIESVPLRSVRKWRTAKLGLLKRLVARGVALWPRSVLRRVSPHTRIPPVWLLPWRVWGGPTLPCSWRRVRPCLVKSNTTLAELLDGAASYVDSTEARAPPCADQQKVIWEKTSHEVLAKFMDPSVSTTAVDVRWGRNLWRPVVRFAVEERSGKFRVIDSGLSGSHNSCTSASERIHTCSNLASLAIARRVAALCATPLHGDLEILQGSGDMKKAFRQVPLQNARLRFAVIALWSPLLSTWVYAQLRAMPFGLVGALLDLNRVSGALVALSRRWFGVPVLGFYDDFKVTELRASLHLPRQPLFVTLQPGGASCWTRTRARRRPRARSSSAVGRCLRTTVTPRSSHCFRLLSAWRRSRMSWLTCCARHVAHGRLLTLRGKLIHLFSVMTGRLGRSLTAYLSQMIAEEADVAGCAPRALIGTNIASCTDGCARLCCLVYHPATAPRDCVSEIPCTFLGRCVPRDTQIFPWPSCWQLSFLYGFLRHSSCTPPCPFSCAMLPPCVRMSMVAPRRGTFRTYHWLSTLHFAVFGQSLGSSTLRVSPTLLTVGRVLA